MQYRTLGNNGTQAGPQVSAIGLGCMGMSAYYANTGSEADALATLEHALDAGITLFDTADVYGPRTNESLLGRFLQGKRDKVFLATKCGILFDQPDPSVFAVSGRPEYVKAACEASLQRLGTDHIDLYYLHRVDPAVPIEDTMGAMAQLVQQGKVRHVGLSEASADTIRRAHAVHPLSAVQSELSLWSQDPLSNGVMHCLQELGIALVPYSPLGRGFLTGAIQKFEDFAANDWRRGLPRFQGENFQRNLLLVDEVKRLAHEKNITSGQLALAWVLAQGPMVVPIPGTTRSTHLDDNLGAINVELSRSDLDRLAKVFATDQIAGERYSAERMAALDH